MPEEDIFFTVRTSFSDASAAAAFAAFSPSSHSAATYAVRALEQSAANNGVSAYASVASDASVLAAGKNLNAAPLWPGDNPFAEVWSAARQKLQDAPDDWSAVIEWYEHLLDPKGRALPVDMLREIVTLPEEVWEGGPPKALPVIGEIWGRYMWGGAPSEVDSQIDLIRVTLYRFAFDQVAELMRAVQPSEDWKRLEDPLELARLLADAGDLLEDIALVCTSLEREGTTLQGGGTARTYLESLRNELERAKTSGILRVSKLIEWVRLLDGLARREETRLEFGAVADPFVAVVDGLGNLVRNHFAHVLGRVSDLRGLALEEGDSHRSVLDMLRDCLGQIHEGAVGERPPLASDDAAAFHDMLDGIDRMIRDLDRAEDAGTRSALQRDIDFQMAKVVVTLQICVHDSRNAMGLGLKGTGLVLDIDKKATGIGSLVKRLWDALNQV